MENFLVENLVLILGYLDAWVIMVIVIMLVLHYTGSLERLAKTFNFWLKSLSDADKARREYKKELDVIETGHEAKLETLEVEARLQSQAAYGLENQRFRQALFEFTREHISFLEKETSKNNAFFRDIIEKGVMENNVVKTSDKKDTE